jgi:hypothetical protein
MGLIAESAANPSAPFHPDPSKKKGFFFFVNRRQMTKEAPRTHAALPVSYINLLCGLRKACARVI